MRDSGGRCELGMLGMLSRVLIVFMEAMTNESGMDDAGGTGTYFCHGDRPADTGKRIEY